MEKNKIYFDKCENVITKFENDWIDLIITSPPYADSTDYGTEVNIFSPENYPDWFIPIAQMMYRTVKPTGSFILNINDRVSDGARSTYVYDLVHRMSQETDWKLYDRYIWYKKSGLPSGSKVRLADRIEYLFHFVKDPQNFKNFSDRIRVPYAESSIGRMKSAVGIHDKIDKEGITESRLKKMEPNPLGRLPDGVFRFPTAGTLKNDYSGVHPAAYHPALPKFFIEWLTDKGDLVYDPFMGSGTTAEACCLLDRNYVGTEMNDAYKEIIEKRIKDVVPEKSFFGF